jgi:ribonuclease HI
MPKVTIYTDGACSGNPGPGGWAAVLICGDTRKEISGGSKNTTNNIMELTAICEALKSLKVECDVEVYSDSAYCVNAFNQNWIYGWIKKGWRTSDGSEVKNKEIWQEIYSLTKKHKVKFIKVKGHSDVELNNRCDELARGEIEKCF